MTKEEFFNKINNPLENDELLEIILKSYYNNHNIYNELVKTNTKDKICGLYNQKDRDDYNIYLFNIWKNNVLQYDINKFPKEEQEVFKRLQNKLNAFVPNNNQEIDEFIFNLNDEHDQELEHFLVENAYTAQGENTGWNHISDRYLSFFKRITPKTKHRLYLNINSTYIDKFAKRFTEKCYENNLPFYYKYDSYGNRADTFIIYSDTNNLFNYISILEEIREEYKEEFAENIKKPPITTANIDNWLGYGSEPQIKTKKKYSYNTLREKIATDVLDRFNTHWTNTHKDKDIIINGQNISYKEFLSNLIYETYIESFDNNVVYTKDPNQVNYDGYSLNDTKSEVFREKLKTIIYKNIDYIIENLDNLDNIDESRLYKMTTRVKDKLFTIDKKGIKKALKKQPYILSKENKNFYNQFRNAIKKESLRYNISENNYCFDKISLKEINELTNTENKSKVKNIEINNTIIRNPQLYRLNKDQIIQDLPIKESSKKLCYTK